MLKPLLLSACLIFCGALTAAAQTPMSTPATSDYVKMAGQSDQFEIQEGRLAAKSASTAKVRRFGKEMIKDHEKSTKLVMAAAKKSGVTPPSEPPMLDSDQQQMLASLEGKTGKAFDDAYLSQQMQAHKQALTLQEGYAAGGSDPNFQAAARKIVPVVKKHIAMLNRMAPSASQGM